jgi:hypothetical protein
MFDPNFSQDSLLGSSGSLAPHGTSPHRRQDFSTASRRESSKDPTDHSSSFQIRGDFDHLVNPGGLKNIPSIHKYNSPVLEHFDSLISDRDYIGFLNALETQATEPYLVVEGFSMFTRYVVSDQLAKPSSVILGGDGWVKTIKHRMERFMNDRGVVRQGLMTLLSISSLSGNYKKFKGTAELVEIINNYDGDQEIRE